MKGYVIPSYGNAATFQEVELPRPEVSPGHVCVRVMATSINPIDCKIRSGAVKLAPDFPAVLHGDVSGVVDEIGEGVTGFKVGDAVYGYAGGIKGMGGALADYMVVDARLIAHKPRTLSHAHAAALPLVAITAWQGLMERVTIKRGDKVLIHGAVGGVGHIGIQLAKYKGATVYATASSEEKLEIGLRLGADVVINHKREQVDEYVEKYTDGKGFDIIFDSVGGTSLDASFQAAKISGHVVSIGTRSKHDLTRMHEKGLTLHVVFTILPLLHNEGRERYGAILKEIAELVDVGKMKPLLDPNAFTFSEVAEAHEYMERAKAYGKVVLTNEG